MSEVDYKAKFERFHELRKSIEAMETEFYALEGELASYAKSILPLAIAIKPVPSSRWRTCLAEVEVTECDVCFGSGYGSDFSSSYSIPASMLWETGWMEEAGEKLAQQNHDKLLMEISNKRNADLKMLAKLKEMYPEEADERS